MFNKQSDSDTSEGECAEGIEVGLRKCVFEASQVFVETKEEKKSIFGGKQSNIFGVNPDLKNRKSLFGLNQLNLDLQNKKTKAPANLFGINPKPKKEPKVPKKI